MKVLRAARDRRPEHRRRSAIVQIALMAGAVIALLLFASPDSRLFMYAPVVAIGWYLCRPDGEFSGSRQVHLGLALVVLSATAYVATYRYGAPLILAAVTLEAFAVRWLVATVVTSPWDTPRPTGSFGLLHTVHSWPIWVIGSSSGPSPTLRRGEASVST